MSESVTLDLLSTELGRLGAQIGAQHEALASGSAAEKVQAAGDPAELKQRAANIGARLQQLAEGEQTLSICSGSNCWCSSTNALCEQRRSSSVALAPRRERAARDCSAAKKPPPNWPNDTCKRAWVCFLT
jgi:hypothetical protein